MMNHSDTVRELCAICEAQNRIIQVQSDALGQLGAMVDAICEMDEAHAASVAALEDALREIETDNGGTV